MKAEGSNIQAVVNFCDTSTCSNLGTISGIILKFGFLFPSKFESQMFCTFNIVWGMLIRFLKSALNFCSSRLLQIAFFPQLRYSMYAAASTSSCSSSLSAGHEKGAAPGQNGHLPELSPAACPLRARTAARRAWGLVASARDHPVPRIVFGGDRSALRKYF